jgi:hypothetical protein
MVSKELRGQFRCQERVVEAVALFERLIGAWKPMLDFNRPGRGIGRYS